MRILADASLAWVQRLLSGQGELELFDPRKGPPAAPLRQAQALVVSSRVAVDAGVLQGAPNLRLVATGASGHDHIDAGLCAGRGVRVATGRGANAPAVAEYCLVALGLWLRCTGRTAAGLRAGLLGCGAAGSALGRALQELGAEVLYADPWVRDGPGRRVSPQEVAGCEMVSLHVPLVEDGPHPTRGLWDRDMAALLPREGLLLQTSRGAVATAGALRETLRRGHLALDVWPDEPRAEVQLARQALLATPHIAGQSLRARHAMGLAVVEALHDLRRSLGEGPPPPAPPPLPSLQVRLKPGPLQQDWDRHGLPAGLLCALTGLPETGAALARQLAEAPDKAAAAQAFRACRLAYPGRPGLDDLHADAADLPHAASLARLAQALRPAPAQRPEQPTI